MKVLFLIVTFLPFILTVHAQRQFKEYLCQVWHKNSEVAFYMQLNSKKEVEVGGWKTLVGVKRKRDQIEVSLSRIVNVLDATYRKEARELYPLNSRDLPVVLEHTFGGRNDIFNLVCHPRDP